MRTWSGTAEVQLGQLDRLLALMIERLAVGSAGFWIFDDSIVAVETPTASIEVVRPQEIDQYARMFGVLAAPAMYGRVARDLVTRIIGELGERDSSTL